MTKIAFVLSSTMTALLLSASALADIYRCTVDGKVQYTDRPCADGDLVVRSRSDKIDRESGNNSAETKNAGSRNDAVENRRAAADARKQEVESMAAQREGDDLWQRRNMSAACFTQKYNEWSLGRNPRPTQEETDRKIGEFLRQCRDIYRIPQDISATEAPSARKQP